MSRATTAALLKAIQTAQAGGVSDADLLRRFSDDNDQAAFAGLLRRHGGMVLGVCRRVLPNLQDAEDAFQATFLILARKARSHNRWQASVANWLYATARKVSRNARVAAQRRARREARAAVPEVVQAVDGMSGRELLAALDEELDRLPPRYREPLVLCYLEGLTRDEAAVRLGVPAGTIKIQLERGRKRLGAALMGRGCALGAGLLTLAATSPAGASQPRVFEDVLAAIAGSPRGAVATLLKGVAVQVSAQEIDDCRTHPPRSQCPEFRGLVLDADWRDAARRSGHAGQERRPASRCRAAGARADDERLRSGPGSAGPAVQRGQAHPGWQETEAREPRHVGRRWPVHGQDSQGDGGANAFPRSVRSRRRYRLRRVSPGSTRRGRSSCAWSRIT